MYTYIVDGIRTPVGSFGGSLATVRPDDMAAHVLQQLMAKNTKIDPSLIEDVYMGCVNQAGEDNRNVARMAVLLAGFPVTVPGETVNRLCASGMSAIVTASRAIGMGDADLLIAGGVENMTRSPYVIGKSAKPFGTDMEMFDSSFGWRFINPKMAQLYGTEAMGMTAENLVDIYHISREDQDQFALWSQKKAYEAIQNGRLAQEITPISIKSKSGDTIFEVDEFVKGQSTIEKLATLKPAFKKDGTVTAGNASGLNDGAAALLLASEKAVHKYGLASKIRIIANGVSGVEPRIMGIGPVEASRKALAKAGLSINHMDIVEINEAFAAQAIACLRLMNIKDDDQRVNPNGGAIAIGHPLGMSGARIINTAAIQLQQTNKKYALVTMCIGVGQGYAVILENLH